MPKPVPAAPVTLRSLERPGLRHVGAALAIGTTVAYAWWATGLRPFTWPSLLAVVTAGLLAILLGTRWRKVSEARRDVLPGVWMWGLLCGLLAAWELAAYLQQPRAEHPTLSSLADQVLDGHPLRALAFLVWLTVGVDLARR